MGHCETRPHQLHDLAGRQYMTQVLSHVAMIVRSQQCCTHCSTATCEYLWMLLWFFLCSLAAISGPCFNLDLLNPWVCHVSNQLITRGTLANEVEAILVIEIVWVSDLQHIRSYRNIFSTWPLPITDFSKLTGNCKPQKVLNDVFYNYSKPQGPIRWEI